MNDESHPSNEPTVAPGQECRDAITLGERFLTTNVDSTQYRLIKAENLVGQPAYRGPRVWRLTFKLSRLIPPTADEEIGAGGELFVEVDLSTGDVRLLGHGE